MKTIFCLIFVLTWTSGLFCQSHALEWVFGISGTGTGHNYANAITTDIENNLIVTGSLSSDSTDLDPGAGTSIVDANGGHIFVAKYSPSGSYIWSFALTGNSFIKEGRDVKTDSTGNIYLTGYFVGTTDFDPGPGVHNLHSGNGTARSIFVAKYDQDGNYLWANSIGSTANAEGNAVDIDRAGNVYFAGYFLGMVDFNNTGTTFLQSQDNDAFLCKYNPEGNFVWAFPVGGPEDDVIIDLEVDKDDHIVVSGFFQGNVDFDPGPGSHSIISTNSIQDMFVAKYDQNGSHLWAFRLKGVFPETNTLIRPNIRISLDQSGNIYAAGNYKGSVDFSPLQGSSYLLSSANLGVFMAKYSPQGMLFWAKSLNSAQNQFCDDITLDRFNNVYLAGVANSNADLDPDSVNVVVPAVSSTSYFLGKYDQSGNYVWHKAAHAFSMEYYKSRLHIGNKNVIYLSANYTEYVHFHGADSVFNLTANGPYDECFLAKLKCQAAPSYNIIHVDGCNTYQAPDGSLYDSSGVYNCILENAAGCDSILTIYLTLNKSYSTINDYICGPYVAPDDQVFTQPGSYTVILPNAAGCDSVITLNLASMPGPNIQVADPAMLSGLTGDSYQWIDCLDGNAEIPGENQQSFTPAHNGEYAVIVFLNSCSDTSGCVQITQAGMFERDPDSFELFPNPGSETVFVRFHFVPDRVAYRVLSLSGQLVQEGDFSGNAVIGLDLRLLDAGLYVLELENDGKISRTRFMKE